MNVGAPDVDREVSEVPAALPALADVTVRGPVVWPVVTRMEPQVDCVSGELLPDRGSLMFVVISVIPRTWLR